MTRIERALLLATVILSALAGVGWYVRPSRHASRMPSIAGATNDIRRVPPESVDAAAREVVETDPFRLARHPSLVAYRPDLEGVSPPPKPPKPRLVLSGLVGDAALIDGAPGYPETAIVHAGDTIGGLRVRRVGPDTVTVSGSDTTWRLTLRHLWQ